MQNAPSARTIRVLGIDPAAAGPTGYGIVEAEGRKCRALHFGALRVGEKRKESAGAALEAVHDLICDLIRKFSPDAVAVESIFSALNVKTALRLAEVRGVVLLAASQHQVEVFSYAPREVKASVAGYGNADKRQMQLMVRALLAMSETPEPPDAADALAVAMCHLQADAMRTRFGASPVSLPGKSSSRSEVVRAAAATQGASSRISSLR
ncbi:MAG: crossover junction endodeoxyribonuclease RuvC [Acidobacteria bacterium]|nr:crossover junction endodeoxyribonuclease RuvC [Acidobacteriota bacterium]MBS1866155.1 crossover junction endodeoxyribonuclease RuvC [Acidobacteriota bacterium]